MSSLIPKYRHTYIAKINYLVRYKCCSCGAENTDSSMFLPVTVRKTADTLSELANMDGLGEAALKERVDALVKKMREAIVSRYYDRLGLKCRCSVCGKRQPWSNFRSPWGSFLPLLRLYHRTGLSVYEFFFLLFFGLYFIRLLLEYFLSVPSSYFFYALCLLAIPSVVACIRNLILMNRCEKLDEEHLPEISIPSPPDRFEILNDGHAIRAYSMDGREKELEELKKGTCFTGIFTVVAFSLLAAARFISNTPSITNPTLQFAAGVVRSYPLIPAYGVLSAVRFIPIAIRYGKLSRQMKADRGSPEPPQEKENNGE